MVPLLPLSGYDLSIKLLLRSGIPKAMYAQDAILSIRGFKESKTKTTILK